MSDSTFTVKVGIHCDVCQKKIIRQVNPNSIPGEIYCDLPCDTLNYLDRYPDKADDDGIYWLEVTKSVENLLFDDRGI